MCGSVSLDQSTRIRRNENKDTLGLLDGAGLRCELSLGVIREVACMFGDNVPRMTELGGLGLALLEVGFPLLIHDGVRGGLRGREILYQRMALDW